MSLRNHVVLLLSSLIAFFLDTAIFPKWNYFHIVPFAMLALMFASGHVFSVQTAILIGAVGGLFEDLLCENIIGLTPALCLLAAATLEKIPRDSETKPFVLFLYFFVLASCVEIMRSLAALIIGMRFGFINAMLYGVLPRAVFTGLLALGYVALFKPLLKRQVDTK